MRVVGNAQWSEFEPDPQKAWARGRALDARMKLGVLAHPTGVWRMSHAQMNAFDEARQRTQAAVLNQPSAALQENERRTK